MLADAAGLPRPGRDLDPVPGTELELDVGEVGVLTVLSEMKSSALISCSVRPRATARTRSSSRVGEVDATDRLVGARGS